MKVKVGISNHHVHLNFNDYKKLFQNQELSVRNELNQPNQFASNLTVDIIGTKGKLTNVRVLGPIRDYTQVELSKTDCRLLGIEAPVRTSGDLEDACLITIVGPFASINKRAAIIANRHIHVDKKIREENNLVGIKEVSLKIFGEKSGIINNVYLKDSDEAYFEAHLDTDDGNAFLLNNNDEVEIVNLK